MARHDIQKLGQELRNTEFRFMARGEHHLHIIYRAVKTEFPDLCDDNYLCSENCSKGHNQPEWNHAVRRTLDQLKYKSLFVSKERINYWIFK